MVPKETSDVLIRSEVVGVAKVTNNYNDLVNGSLTRQKLQNSKGYAKSPEFSPALQGDNSWGGGGGVGGATAPPTFGHPHFFSGFSHTTDRKVPSEVVLMGSFST